MEFQKWPSIPRLSKERVTVTEKIDGSNSAIRIRPLDLSGETNYNDSLCTVGLEDETYAVWAQSRSRFLKPTKSEDNFGFARWVYDNAVELVKILGPGDHYGEWWGSGIQRSYGLKEKRFSLFNAHRWSAVLHSTEALSSVSNLFVVPILYTGPFYEFDVNAVREDLRENGSKVVPGFRSEGMVVFLRELNASYKVLLEGDDIHKWEMK